MARAKSFSDNAGSDAGQLAKERLAWSLQPLASITVALFWVLNPEVVDRAGLEQVSLWGFIFGAAIGMIGFRHEIRKHLNLRMDGGEYQRNRVPAEFYWGYKAKNMKEGRQETL